MSNMKYKYMYLHTFNCLTLLSKENFDYVTKNVEYFVVEEVAIQSWRKSKKSKNEINLNEATELLNSGRIISIPYVPTIENNMGILREMVARRNEGPFIVLFGYNDEGNLSVFKEVIKLINEHGGNGYLLCNLVNIENVLTGEKCIDLSNLSNKATNNSQIVLPAQNMEELEKLKNDKTFEQGYAIAVDEDEEEGVSVIVLNDDEEEVKPESQPVIQEEPVPAPISVEEKKEEPVEEPQVEEPQQEEAKPEENDEVYEDPFTVSTSSAPEEETNEIEVEEVREEPQFEEQVPEVEEHSEEIVEEKQQEELSEKVSSEVPDEEPQENNEEENKPVEDDLDPFFKGFDF